MGLERCGYCGAPIYVRLAAVWNDDGTVTGRYAGTTRVVQIYSSEINHILAGIGERIGFDISRIVVEGERKAGVQFTEEVLALGRGAAGAISRNRLVSRMVFGFVLRGVKNAGLGKGRLVAYERGRRMSVEFAHPFNVPILAGDMLGAFEAFFKRPGEVSWEGEGDRVLITIESGPSHAHQPEERLKPVLPPTQPGKLPLTRCPRCRMPLEVSRRYDFDLREGIATETSTGRRIVTVIIDSLNAVFKELESELGPEVTAMIVDLESEYIEQNAVMPRAKEGERAIEELLGDMRIKGMGNPSRVSLDERGHLEVRVDNPFSEELLAGRVLGFFRAVAGGPARVRWTPDTGGYMTIEISRCDDSGKEVVDVEETL